MNCSTRSGADEERSGRIGSPRRAWLHGRRVNSKRGRAPSIGRAACRGLPTRRLSTAAPPGGEPIELKFRRRKPKPLRLVVLLDASGSMEPYTAFFTRFVHAVSLSFRESEAF